MKITLNNLILSKGMPDRSQRDVVSDAKEVAKIQEKILRYINARSNNILKYSRGNLDKKFKALTKLTTIFTFNEYSRIDKIADVVVRNGDAFEEIHPHAKSEFYRKKQHLEILALIEHCNQIAKYC